MSIYGTYALWEFWCVREFGCPYLSYLGIYIYSGTSLPMTDKICPPDQEEKDFGGSKTFSHQDIIMANAICMVQ